MAYIYSIIIQFEVIIHVLRFCLACKIIIIRVLSIIGIYTSIIIQFEVIIHVLRLFDM